MSYGYFSTIWHQGKVVMHFVELAEVHAFGFIIQDFESIFHGPFSCLVDTLEFSFYGSHIFGAVTNEEVINIKWSVDFQVVIWLILIMKRITNRMLLWGTPISCGLGSENILFSCLWKVRSSRNCFIKMKSVSEAEIFEYTVWPGHMIGFFKGKKRLQPNFYKK